MSTMEYKGYVTSIEVDAEHNILIGRITNITDVVGFHGTTVANFKQAFHEAVDGYLASFPGSATKPQGPKPIRRAA